MDFPHLNFHDQNVENELARRQDGGSFTTVDGTVFSLAFVTATPTFTGVIGGYTTLTGDGSSNTETPATSAPITASHSNSLPSASSTFSTTSVRSLIAPTTAAITTSAGSHTGSVAAASSTAGSSADSSSSTSSGMSIGAKVGIAVAVIAIVGLLAIFLLWLLGKKRRQLEAQNGPDNEKHHALAGVTSTEMSTRSPPISATAPRISLRPVSRMLPEFLGTSRSRLSAGNMLNTIGESDAPAARKAPPPQARGPSPGPVRGLGLAAVTENSHESHPNNPFADPQNPFADPERQPVQAPAPLVIAPAAARRAPQAAPVAAMVAPVVASPNAAAVFEAIPPPRPAAQPRVQAPQPAPAVVPAAAPVASPIVRQAPPSFPLAASQTSSPVPSAPSSPALIAGSGSGPDAAQGNVYRVLMDFIPSMEDELELRSGQLVRCLHEYDDGWVSSTLIFSLANILTFHQALCIRLDRSQQGVVPRTCLAAKPSKPKPSHLNQYARGTPGGSMSRPMSPAGGPQRPMSPMGRPMSPGGRAMSPMGRPMSPGGMRGPMSPGFNQAPRPMSPGPRGGPSNRSMSPGPYGGRNGPPPMAAVTRRRSNSASNSREKRNSPAGPSKLGPGAGWAI